LSIFWPVLLLILPYLIWNTTVYGSMVPISGLLKTTFPVPALHVEWLYGLKAVWLLLLFAYAASALSCLCKTDDGLSDVLVVLTVGASLHVIYTVIFMNWAVFGWHFVGCLVPGVIGLAYLVRPAMSFLPQAGRVAMAALVLCTTSGLLVRRYVEPDSSFRAAAIAGGRWAKEHLPEDAVLAMKDSGAFTYFSGKRVVNLDGVANSIAYQRALCSGGIENFLGRLNVGYIVQHAVNVDKIRTGYGSFEQAYPCHLRGGEDGRLVMKESQEVFRGPEYYDDGVLVRLVVWRARWQVGTSRSRSRQDDDGVAAGSVPTEPRRHGRVATVAKSAAGRRRAGGGGHRDRKRGASAGPELPDPGMPTTRRLAPRLRAATSGAAWSVDPFWPWPGGR
jgi:hypothetical protein